MSELSFISGLALWNWLKRSAKFGDGFKSNEVSFVSAFFVVFVKSMTRDGLWEGNCYLKMQMGR